MKIPARIRQSLQYYIAGMEDAAKIVTIASATDDMFQGKGRHVSEVIDEAREKYDAVAGKLETVLQSLTADKRKAVKDYLKPLAPRRP